MREYTDFATVYDVLMDNIPYADWCRYLTELLCEYGVMPGQQIVELGCGTGNMSRRLSAQGYEVTGIDCSPDMLSVAMDRAEEGADVFYVQQDMRRFSLPYPVDAVVSICDSMNYMLKDKDLYRVCSRVKRFLKKEGVFVFDMKTPYFYREVCGDNTFAQNREEVGMIWENCFDETSAIHEYALTLFLPHCVQNETLWRKHTEYHYQRAYERQEVERALQSAGLHLLKVYAQGTHHAPNEQSERVYYIAGA